MPVDPRGPSPTEYSQENCLPTLSGPFQCAGAAGHANCLPFLRCATSMSSHVLPALFGVAANDRVQTGVDEAACTPPVWLNWKPPGGDQLSPVCIALLNSEFEVLDLLSARSVEAELTEPSSAQWPTVAPSTPGGSGTVLPNSASPTVPISCFTGIDEQCYVRAQATDRFSLCHSAAGPSNVPTDPAVDAFGVVVQHIPTTLFGVTCMGPVFPVTSAACPSPYVARSLEREDRVDESKPPVIACRWRVPPRKLVKTKRGGWAATLPAPCVQTIKVRKEAAPWPLNC
jgi:hypothetical protein